MSGVFFFFWFFEFQHADDSNEIETTTTENCIFYWYKLDTFLLWRFNRAVIPTLLSLNNLHSIELYIKLQPIFTLFNDNRIFINFAKLNLDVGYHLPIDILLHLKPNKNRGEVNEISHSKNTYILSFWHNKLSMQTQFDHNLSLS